MKAITLRDIPEPIAEEIQKRARVNGTSINKTVIEMLANAANAMQKRRRQYHDLDHLIGCWSDDELLDVNAAVEQQRVIDTELWK